MMDKRKLLLVDDEANIRATLGAILQLRGYEVTTAASVKEALAAVQAAKYDVLLSDLNIGQPYDGFVVTSATRRLHPEIKTVMMTGYPAFESALQSIREQVDDYLIKPMNVEELVERIEAMLNSPKRLRPEQRKRPVDVVDENRDAVISRWLATVEADVDLAKLPMEKAQRTGYLPRYLDALITQIRSGDPAVTKLALLAAVKHGQQRRQAGYSLSLLVRETRILKTTIYETLQEHLLEIKISRLIAEIIGFSISMTEQLEHSICEFAESNAVA